MIIKCEFFITHEALIPAPPGSYVMYIAHSLIWRQYTPYMVSIIMTRDEIQ